MARVPWTAPDVERADGSLVAGERELLQGFLDFHRATLVHKCAGLTGEQLAARAIAPSTLSLLGLIRHMAKVERTWFRIRFAGEAVAPLYGPEQGVDADFELVDPARAEHDHEQLVAEWRLADAAVAGRSLSDRFDHRGEPFSLRAIYLHLIGEYARHNGHADVLRQRIDGVTGA
jgi:hypothetical protein